MDITPNWYGGQRLVLDVVKLFFDQNQANGEARFSFVIMGLEVTYCGQKCTKSELRVHRVLLGRRARQLTPVYVPGSQINL